jgi:hypothetical protein
MEQSRFIPALPKGLWSMAALVVGLLGFVATPALAEPPTTAPSTPQAVERAASIHRAFRDLADPQPSVRDDARSWLLTLDRDDLPLLREVVKRARSIQRSQIAALREIVSHVYLRGDLYEPDPSRVGFMGVMFGSPLEVNEPESGGVEVRRRMCGFCAFRYLEDGDIIRAVVGPPTLTVHMPDDIIAAVKTCHAGDIVVLEVLRGGRILRIPILLDVRPKLVALANEAATSEFLGRRQAEADNYWDETFEPLIGEKVL